MLAPFRRSLLSAADAAKAPAAAELFRLQGRWRYREHAAVLAPMRCVPAASARIAELKGPSEGAMTAKPSEKAAESSGSGEAAVMANAVIPQRKSVSAARGCCSSLQLSLRLYLLRQR